MDSLKFSLAAIKREISKAENLVNIATIKADLESISLLQLYIRRVPDLHQRLDKIVDGQTHSFEGEDFDNAVEAIEDLREALNKLSIKLKPFESQSTQQVKLSSGNINLNLPRLDIPKFNGDILAYENFRSLFDVTVLKSDLSDAQKIAHLLLLVDGEPHTLIKHSTLDSSGLQLALQMLDERYSSSRQITQTLIDRLFDLKPIQHRSLSSIEHLYSTFTEILAALKVKQINIDSLFLARYLIKLLDKQTRELFEAQYIDNSVPTTTSILTFLKTQIKFLQNLDQPLINLRTAQTNKSVKVFNSNSMYPDKSNVCPMCDNGHSIYRCHKYLNLSVGDRKKFVSSKNLCFNCLSNSHSKVSECASMNLCRQCNLKHHSSLCSYSTKTAGYSSTHHNNSKRALTTHQNPSSNYNNSSVLTHNNPSNHTHPTSDPVTLNVAIPELVQSNPSRESQVLLSTVQVQIIDKFGQIHVVRGLLDSAAEHSFITANLVSKLKLENIRNTELSVSGFSNNKVKLCGTTSCTVNSLHNDFSLQITVGIVPNITSFLPSSSVSRQFLNQFCELPLADPNFDSPGSIDILLDASVFAQVLQSGRLATGHNLPTLYETAFGWVLTGRAPVAQTHKTVSVNTVVLTSTCCDVDLTLKRFWEWEAPPDKSHDIIHPTEQFFRNTFYRLSSGRFGVRLPFDIPSTKLGTSYQNAFKFLLSLERKFYLNSELRVSYTKSMKDLIDDNILSKMSSDYVPPPDHYFMPHFAVTKDPQDLSRIRIVYNGSAKTSSGVSLNQVLSKGPTLQTDNIQVLLLFRLFAVAFCCDVKAMFTQIEVHPEDRCFQLVLWREESTEPISIYTYNRVVFGLSPSPYLAIRALRQTAEEGKLEFPLASEAILDCSFVDDVLVSLPSSEQACLCRNQLISLLRTGKFELGKWVSNDPNLLKDLPPGSCLESKNILDPSLSSVAVLGLRWDPITDSFSFNLSDYNKEFIPSKRNILSMVAKVYDPLGLIAPLTSWLKIFLQMLWLRGLGWDDLLPEDLTDKWLTFLSQMDKISLIKIPRPILIGTYLSFQIHGFADASEKCYAGVVYSRLELSSGKVITNLIISKTKVSPLKVLTIPRLELNAALLLAKLLDHTISTFSPKVSISSIHAWSDSNITLAWIKTPPHLLKTYVSNRVQSILDLTSPSIWAHVPTDLNPADLPSRGLLPSALVSADLWWQGPKFLRLPQSLWPNRTLRTETSIPELKPNATTALVTTNLEFHHKFSSWSQALRVVAQMLRFCALARKRKIEGPLRVKELLEAETCLIRLIQFESLGDVIKSLNKGQPLKPSFRKLSVFLDSSQVIRAGGRLEHSNLPYSIQHPAILPKTHYLVNLLIKHAHLTLLHAGPQAVGHHLLQKFWILSARSLIRKVVFQCVTCFRCKPSRPPPLMGALPSPRVIPSRPFSQVGLDYSGFFIIKLNKTRKAVTTDKAYICLFICLSTRAVHLEVVTDMTTTAFISALIRFTSRRGLCSDIFCDQGTNFIGGSTMLHNLLVRFLKSHQTTIDYFAANKGIQFHFNPPAAPFQGGIWESAIKMAKYHLKRVIGSQLLTLEEFITLVIQVEGVLNSRPISPSSSDPSDLVPLTPSHFLTGSSLLNLPVPDYTQTKISSLQRWEFIQQLYQQFWKRWQREYLPSLIPRNKWNQPCTNLVQDQLVIVHEDQSPPCCWPMARVVEVMPGKDGVVRVARVKTLKGELLRPVLKLYPLPIID